MKKKTDARWKWALWLLVLGAILCLVLAPINRHPPKLQWRAPVHVTMPKMPEVPKSLPGLPTALPSIPDLPKVTMPDLDKIQESIHDKVDDVLQEIPPFPYEVAPKKAPPVVPVPVPAHPPAQGKGARIAIIIDDMGLVPTLSARAVKLPPSITLSYLPYAPHVQQQTESAAATGHDLMLHLPMEPLGHENPGPDALFVADSDDVVKAKVHKALASFDGFIGVNNHMGSKFTLDVRGMSLLADALREKGVFFIDSRTSPKSEADTIVRFHGVKAASRDVFLDDTQTAASIRGELARLEKLAHKNGSAIAIGHPHAVTLDELERWVPEAQARGFVIVPVRALLE